MSKNWEVGEVHGDFKVIGMTATEATFEGPNGVISTYPNIFQEKTELQKKSLQKVNKVVLTKKDKISKISKVSKDTDSDTEVSEDTLLEELAKVKAHLASLKKIHA